MGKPRSRYYGKDKVWSLKKNRWYMVRSVSSYVTQYSMFHLCYQNKKKLLSYLLLDEVFNGLLTCSNCVEVLVPLIWHKITKHRQQKGNVWGESLTNVASVLETVGTFPTFGSKLLDINLRSVLATSSSAVAGITSLRNICTNLELSPPVSRTLFKIIKVHWSQSC